MLGNVEANLLADLADHGERIDAVHDRLDALTPTAPEREIQHDH